MTERPRTRIAFHESLQHPLTLFPTAMGLLGSLTTILFGANPVTASVAVGGLAIGAGSWAVNYFFRKDIFLKSHLLRMQAESERRMTTLLRDLENNFKLQQLPVDATEHAQQALQQLRLIQDSFGNFKSILSAKLDSREITFHRFLVSAEQVNLSMLDNLQNISTRLKSIGAIDPDYIRKRIEVLDQLKKIEATDENERETLKARKTIRDEQLSRVNELLTYNEQALTQLAKANSAIVDMRGKGGHTSMELDTATLELEEIAQRAKKF